jgi:hypothetical protein
MKEIEIVVEIPLKFWGLLVFTPNCSKQIELLPTFHLTIG